MTASGLRLIDAHCHVNFNAYKEDADDVIRRSLEQGVGMFAVGSQRSTSERAVAYADANDGVWAVIGLHPIHLHEHYVDEDEVQFRSREESFDRDAYARLARSSSKVVGIGECGLDYYHLPEGVDPEEMKERQRNAFREQIDLALDLDLPLMVHCRDAHDDVAAILEGYAADGRPVRGDIHCFTGTVDEARRYLALGLFISFTGIITFPPKRAEKERGETLQDVVAAVPLDRILVETDAPYLSPVPYRGKRNEPLYVTHVADKIAEIKGDAPDAVRRQTLSNTRSLFRI